MFHILVDTTADRPHHPGATACFLAPHPKPFTNRTITTGYNSPMASRASKPPTDGIGFLLSQLGHRAATLFAELLTPLDLTPPLAGIVRL